MRIVAGKYKSRILAEPKGHVAHPMGERVRAALFSILHNVEGYKVLDAYAGSGAIAIEAISRGAAKAWAIEKSAKVYRTLDENVKSMDLEEEVKATRANVSTWADNNEDLRFDLIVCDPPYNDLNPMHMDKLAGHLDNGGVFVLSHLSAFEPIQIEGLKLISSHEYGNATLSIYKAN